jgi:hypothetical protein
MASKSASRPPFVLMLMLESSLWELCTEEFGRPAAAGRPVALGPLAAPGTMRVPVVPDWVSPWAGPWPEFVDHTTTAEVAGDSCLLAV